LIDSRTYKPSLARAFEFYLLVITVLRGERL
jgi:hypothetical protein